MMRIVVDTRWRVDATAWLDVPLGASAVWGQMRDIQRFLTLDPLHKRVRGGLDAWRTFQTLAKRLAQLNEEIMQAERPKETRRRRSQR